MENKRVEKELTKRLYETDGFVKDFTAKVVEIINVPYEKYNKDNICGLVLDRTAFFPEGGGQQCDEGSIDDIKVIDVQIDTEGRIVHYLDTIKTFQKGDTIEGTVDFNTRFPRMQSHSGEHIISGLVNARFGYDNVGFHMSEKTVRFDFNGSLSKEDMAKIESQANECIYKNIPIEVFFPTEDEIESLEYRSKLEITQGLRIVAIEGVDVCACCAPHVNTTGQIGIIKIIDVMPHRQGTRVTMVAGVNALEDYDMLHEANGKIMSYLSSKRDTTAEFTNELLERNSRLKEENNNLKREISGFVTRDFMDRLSKRNSEDTYPEVIFSNVLDNVGMRNLINDGVKIFGGIIAGFIGDDSSGYRYILGTGNTIDNDIVKLSKKLNDEFDGKGGGNASMVQGSLFGKMDSIEKLIKSLN